MTARRIAVISAGLSNPSSTRLLADRLASATVRALGEPRASRPRSTCSSCATYAHDITNNLLTGFAAARARDGDQHGRLGATRVIAVTPIFSTSYSRAVQVVHRRARPGRADRQARADRRERRHARGTRSRSTTRSARCSPTCTPSRSRPACSRRPSDWGARGRPGRTARRAHRARCARARRGDRAARAGRRGGPVRPGQLPRRGPLVRAPAGRARGGVAAFAA